MNDALRKIRKYANSSSNLATSETSSGKVLGAFVKTWAQHLPSLIHPPASIPRSENVVFEKNQPSRLFDSCH